MNEIKLKLTDSRYGFGFAIYRKVDMTYNQFDIFSQKLLKSINEILKELGITK